MGHIDNIMGQAPKPVRAWKFPAVTVDGVGLAQVDVWFKPVENAPGYSHRAIVNGRAGMWLGDHSRPCEESAKLAWARWVESNFHPKMCEECGTNPGDPNTCAGCDAYREHTAV
jgi:hypothetical protein